MLQLNVVAQRSCVCMLCVRACFVCVCGWCACVGVMAPQVMALSSSGEDVARVCWAAFEGSFETWKRLLKEEFYKSGSVSLVTKLLDCVRDVGVRGRAAEAAVCAAAHHCALF